MLSVYTIAYFIFQPKKAYGGSFFFISSTLISFIYVNFIIYNEYLKKDFFSPISIFSILMLFHFIIPGLFIPFYSSFFSDPFNFNYIGEAQAFILLCYFAFHIGYIFFNLIKKKTYTHGLTPTRFKVWKNNWVGITLIIFLIIGWLSRLYILENMAYSQFSRQYSDLLKVSYDSVIRIIELFPRYALIITCIHYWNTEFKINLIKWRLFLSLQIIIELLYWTPTGRKTEIILTIILPIIIKYIITKKLPSKKALLIVSFSILMLFPVMHYYRTAMDVGGFSKIASIEDIFASVESAKDLDFQHRKSPLKILLGRISLIESVSGSIRIIRTKIWDPFVGKTYYWVLIGIVPGFFWKNKPDFSFGTEFGHAAGILDYSNKITSISVTYMGEAFLNFQWLGVFVFFIFGLGFSIIYKWVLLGRKDSTRLLIYILILPSAIYIGGTFAQYFNGLLKLILIFYFLSIFISEKKSIFDGGRHFF